jgi:hypothetical protein
VTLRDLPGGQQHVPREQHGEQRRGENQALLSGLLQQL